MSIDPYRRHLLRTAAGMALLAASAPLAPAIAGPGARDPGVAAPPGPRRPTLPERSDAVPPPPADFAAGISAEQVTAGLDLRGRTLLVTGATSGIGLELLRVLALRGARVIGTARAPEKAAEIAARVPGAIEFVPLELSDFVSVRACAANVRAMTTRLDGLVCNAGVVLDGLEQVDGVEKTFVVNHLGHFLLVAELLPTVLAAAQGRVVVLGSGDHHRAPAGGIQFDDLSGRGWQARYAHSKLANGLFSAELARRLAGTRASSNCVTPGHTRTAILRDVGNSYRDDARSVAVGAATPIYAAVHPALAATSGAYLADFRAGEQSAHQRDVAMARRLWDVSRQLTQRR